MQNPADTTSAEKEPGIPPDTDTKDKEEERKLREKEGEKEKEMEKRKKAMMAALGTVFSQIKESENEENSINMIIGLSADWGKFSGNRILIKGLVSEIKKATDFGSFSASVSSGQKPKLNSVVDFFAKSQEK